MEIRPSAPRRFKTNFSGLYDLGIDIIQDLEKRGYSVPVSSMLMRIGKMVIIPQMLEKGISEEEMKSDERKCLAIIETFIVKSAAYWEQIKNHDEKFLVDNSSVLFSDLPENYVNGFKDLFAMKDRGELIVKKEDLDDLWQFLEAMVRISIKHIHLTREPNELLKGTEKYYGKEYFPSLRINKLIEIWQVKM